MTPMPVGAIMGQYIRWLGVDFESVRKALGSGDRSVLERARGTPEFGAYSGFKPKGFKISTGDALELMISGGKLGKRDGSAYGYALICLCAAFSHELPYGEEVKVGYQTDPVNQAMDDAGLDLEFEMELFRNRPDVGLPKIDDFPMLGLVERDEAAVLLRKLEGVKVEGSDDDEDVGEVIDGLRADLAFCLANRLDLFSFWH